MTAVTGLSVLYYKGPPYKKTAPHHRCGLRLSKNLYRYQKWGLGRSPKRGEGGRVDYNIKCNTKNMDIILTFV